MNKRTILATTNNMITKANETCNTKIEEKDCRVQKSNNDNTDNETR